MSEQQYTTPEKPEGFRSYPDSLRYYADHFDKYRTAADSDMIGAMRRSAADVESLRAQLSEAQARLASRTPDGAVLPMLKRLVRLGLDNGMTAEVRALSEMWDELHRLRDAAPVATAAQAARLCGDYPEHQEWVDDGMPCPACAAEEEKTAQAVADDVVRDARLVEVWDWCRLTAQDFGNGNARQQAVAKAYLGIAHHIKSKYFRGCKDKDMFAILAAQQQKAGSE